MNLISNPLEICWNPSREQFIKDICPLRKPVVLKGLNIGPAKETWNVNYLTEKVKNVNVKIHVSPQPQMDFLKKNFLYKTLPFDELINRASRDIQNEYFVCKEEKYYLRSLGTDVRKDVADIRKDFPQICDDILIPEYFEPGKFFSSVFRISSPGVQLWTHYDVMDNFLIQVVGTKRVVLFPPKEALNLYLEGDKSKVVDIDDPDLSIFPKFKDVKRYECILEPGDILFIPALWFHNVIARDFSIGVNVFWRHLDNDCYDQKDVYGNKDPLPVHRAFQTLDKILKQLHGLPDEYRDFYAKRMILKIEQSGNILH